MTSARKTGLHSRRTIRALAIGQALLILVSLLVPVSALAAITSVTPNNMNQGTSGSITILGPGNNFPNANRPFTVTFSGTGVTAGVVTWNNSQSLTTTVTVTGAAATGARTLTVNGAGGFVAQTSTFTVNAALVAQTITFPALAGVRLDQAAPATAATASSGLAVTYSTASTACSVTSGGVITLLTAGNCTIAANQAGNGTYAAAPQVSRSFTIAKGDQTITFGALADKTLLDSPVTIAATASSGLTVAFASNSLPVCTVSGTSVTLLTTGVCSITASQAGNANWNAAAPTVTRTFNVTATQTITFPALAGVRLDQAAPATAATASSGLAVTYSTASTACSVTSGGVITLLAAGNCTIAADQAGNGTYAAAPQVSQSFTIAKGDQTITFGALADKTLLDSPVTIAATASSGLTVAFASNSLPVCTVSGTSVTLLTTGVCSITASQAGNANWNAAPTVTRTFDITTAPSSTVVTCPASVVYDGSAQTPCTVAVTGAGGLSLSPTPIYTLNTNVGTATASYTYAGDANHAGSSDSTTFDITTAPSSTVVTCPASVVYDGSAQTPCTVAVTGAGGLSLSPTPIYTLNTNVGTATASYTYAGDANHAGSSDSTTFDITTAPSSTVVTCPASVVYDGSAQTPCTVAVTGAGGLSLSPTPIYTLNTNVGTATASYTYAGDANHAGSSDSTTFDIVDSASTTVVTWETGPYVYTGSAFTATAEVTGAGGLNESVTVVYSGDCTNVTVPNGCTATATFAGDAGHAGSSDSQSITITQAPQTITFDFVGDKTVGEGSFELVATSGSDLSVTFMSLTPSVCSVSGTTVTILTAGTCTIQADQAGDVNHAAAAPVTQSFEISAAPTPPDTSRSGSTPIAAGSDGAIPLPALIAAMTAFALGVVLMLMLLMLARRRRDEEAGRRHTR